MKAGPNGTTIKHFYTPKEAADVIGVSLTTFYLLLKKPVTKGGPPVSRFGRNCYRLPRDQFLKWAGVETPKDN